eukprot:Partr_v1_DN28337_c0_g1_i1_m79234 putative Inherit from NOG: hedgehog protein
MKSPALVLVALTFYSFISGTLQSELLSASFSLIAGTTANYTRQSSRLSYPTSFATSNSNSNPGPRSSHKIAFYNDLIYLFHGEPTSSNDVWTFEPISKMWAWIAGKSNTANPSLGTRGVTAVSNTPGYRYDFCGTIHEARGDFVLFGGNSVRGSQSDLWLFNLTSSNWTYVTGSTSAFSQAPVYGTPGVAAALNTPGGRFGASCNVDIPTGELLVYGGNAGFGPYVSDTYGDMFAFNFTSVRWKWITGSSTSNAAVVGSKGSWAANYHPSPRAFSDFALDAETGITYLFGGISGNLYMNDLWAFKRSTLEWAWLSGLTGTTARGIYGSRYLASVNNMPGGRKAHSLEYHTTTGSIILFGGFGYGNGSRAGELNDFWAYNLSTSQWTWIHGTSLEKSQAIFTTGQETPAAHQYGAMTVDQFSGDIFMFGGDFDQNANPSNLDHFWKATISSETIGSQVSQAQTATSRSTSKKSSAIAAISASVAQAVTNSGNAQPGTFVSRENSKSHSRSSQGPGTEKGKSSTVEFIASIKPWILYLAIGTTLLIILGGSLLCIWRCNHSDVGSKSAEPSNTYQ